MLVIISLTFISISHVPTRCGNLPTPHWLLGVMETIRPVKVVSSKELIFRDEVLLEGIVFFLALFKPLDDGIFDFSPLSTLIVSVPMVLLSGCILAWTWKSIPFEFSVWQPSFSRETTSVWTCALQTGVGRTACNLVPALFDFNAASNKFHACSLKKFQIVNLSTENELQKVLEKSIFSKLTLHFQACSFCCQASSFNFSPCSKAWYSDLIERYEFRRQKWIPTGINISYDS